MSFTLWFYLRRTLFLNGFEKIYLQLIWDSVYIFFCFLCFYYCYLPANMLWLGYTFFLIITIRRKRYWKITNQDYRFEREWCLFWFWFLKSQLIFVTEDNLTSVWRNKSLISLITTSLHWKIITVVQKLKLSVAKWISKALKWFLQTLTSICSSNLERDDKVLIWFSLPHRNIDWFKWLIYRTRFKNKKVRQKRHHGA